VSIAKDSASRNLTGHYLEALTKRDLLQHGTFGCYPGFRAAKPIPWTDRLCFEALPIIDEKITAPWGSIEFDSLFLSLSYGDDEKDGYQRVRGIRGFILDPPERMFLRSLGQFFLKRDKGHPMQGHVVFIDRLVHPTFDALNPKFKIPGDIWGTDRWGLLEPFCFLDSTIENPAQEMVMYLLNVLTRNLFPEVIGYPDPLHKADWGAKSLLRRVVPMIESSEIQAKRDPLRTKFRTTRDAVKR